MSDKIKQLRIKRDQLNARIQQAEARARATEKKADDRVKVLTGAAVLELLRLGHPVALQDASELLALLDQFLVRPAEREAVLGGDGRGSEALRRVLAKPLS